MSEQRRTDLSILTFTQDLQPKKVWLSDEEALHICRAFGVERLNANQALGLAAALLRHARLQGAVRPIPVAYHEIRPFVALTNREVVPLVYEGTRVAGVVLFPSTARNDDMYKLVNDGKGCWYVAGMYPDVNNMTETAMFETMQKKLGIGFAMQPRWIGDYPNLHELAGPTVHQVYWSRVSADKPGLGTVFLLDALPDTILPYHRDFVDMAVKIATTPDRR